MKKLFLVIVCFGMFSATIQAQTKSKTTSQSTNPSQKKAPLVKRKVIAGQTIYATDEKNSRIETTKIDEGKKED